MGVNSWDRAPPTPHTKGHLWGITAEKFNLMTCTSILCGSVISQDIFIGRYWYYHDILVVDFLKQSPSHQKWSFTRHCCCKKKSTLMTCSSMIVFLSKIPIFLLVDTKLFLWQPLDEQLFTTFPLPQGAAASSTLKQTQDCSTHKHTAPTRILFQILLYPTREHGKQGSQSLNIWQCPQQLWWQHSRTAF